MEITEVRVILTCPTRNYVFVKILTDTDIYGIGEGTLNGNEPAVAQAIEHAGYLLIGHDPMRTQDLWQFLYNQTYWRAGPVQMAALAAIDIALWDIKGKVAGLPVYELLGGRSRDGVLTYSHAGGSSPEAVLADVQRIRDNGFLAIRAQMGAYGGGGTVRVDPSPREAVPGTEYFDPAPYLSETPGLFKFLRQELGMQLDLLHDVHERLTPIEAAWLAKQLEPYRLFYLEDALPQEHFESFRVVRQASSTPLAVGESFSSRWDCTRLFQEQLIDYIRIKPIHVGGITEAVKIMVMAEPAQIRSAFHGAGDIGPIGQAASLHVQMAIPNSGIQEWVGFNGPDSEKLREVTPNPCQWADGYARPHDLPGVGIDVNEEAADAYPYRRAYNPIVRRSDGAMHRY